MKNSTIQKIGELCKEYRTYTKRITLAEMSALTDVNISTLSAFENGRSTNINIFFNYIKLMNSDEEREDFLQVIANLIIESGDLIG